MTEQQRSRLLGLINSLSSLSNGLARDACSFEDVQNAKSELFNYVDGQFEKLMRQKKGAK